MAFRASFHRQSSLLSALPRFRQPSFLLRRPVKLPQFPQPTSLPNLAHPVLHFPNRPRFLSNFINPSNGFTTPPTPGLPNPPPVHPVLHFPNRPRFLSNFTNPSNGFTTPLTQGLPHPAPVHPVLHFPNRPRFLSNFTNPSNGFTTPPTPGLPHLPPNPDNPTANQDQPDHSTPNPDSKQKPDPSKPGNPNANSDTKSKRKSMKQKFRESSQKAIIMMAKAGDDAASVIEMLRKGEGYLNDAFRVSRAAYNLFKYYKKAIKKAFKVKTETDEEDENEIETPSKGEPTPPPPPPPPPSPSEHQFITLIGKLDEIAALLRILVGPVEPKVSEKVSSKVSDSVSGYDDSSSSSESEDD